jgi:hypothetical protein
VLTLLVLLVVLVVPGAAQDDAASALIPWSQFSFAFDLSLGFVLLVRDLGSSVARFSFP